MKKFLCILLCLLLPLTACAAARMPEKRGSINDAADVLSAQTVADLGQFSKQATKEADIDLHVVTVHFLDGLEPQPYAEQLFQKWQMEDDDLLLVCAVGEDSFAIAMGSEAERLLGRANADNLLFTSSEFAQLFRTQQYDAAVAAFCEGLNKLLEKQKGGSVRMEGLFGQQILSVPQKIDEYYSEISREVLDAVTQAATVYRTHSRRAEREENGLTAGGWIVLIVLAVIVMRQNKHALARRTGCGCSPLGWIVGLLGLGFLFKKD